MLAENVEGIANATETVEMLNQAQENLQEVAKNPGIVGTWLQGLIPDLLNFAFQVVVSIIIYIVGSKIINLILKMFRKSMERRDVDTGVRQFVLPLIKYALYLVLIFIIMGLLFFLAAVLNLVTGENHSTAVVWLWLGSAGVAVGLALQGSLSNFAGGVLILLLKPFRVGDYIIEHSGGKEGTVTEISIFYTKLLTIDNKVVMVPNGTLSNSSITNVSTMEKRRVDLVVGIAYEADIRTAKEVLYSVAEAEEARLPEEEILVFVDELGDSSVNMGVRIWVKTEDYWSARWRLTENIKYALDSHNISIPYPQMDVQIKQ